MLFSLTTNENPVISRLELVHAISSPRELFSDGTIDRLQPTGPAAIYTSSVTLWMLVSQRLAGGKSMEATVKDFIADRPTFCPGYKRLNEDTQSCAARYHRRYHRRYDVETDIKCIKVAMDTENITAKSEEMVMKGLYTPVTSYNLVVQFRRQAVDISGVSPRRLSFQGVWDTHESFLTTYLGTAGIEACVERFEETL